MKFSQTILQNCRTPGAMSHVRCRYICYIAYMYLRFDRFHFIFTFHSQGGPGAPDPQSHSSHVPSQFYICFTHISDSRHIFFTIYIAESSHDFCIFGSPKCFMCVHWSYLLQLPRAYGLCSVTLQSDRPYPHEPGGNDNNPIH